MAKVKQNKIDKKIRYFLRNKKNKKYFDVTKEYFFGIGLALLVVGIISFNPKPIEIIVIGFIFLAISALIKGLID